MQSTKTVVGYVRVSTEEQGTTGASLAAQKGAIEAACAARGLTLIRIEEDALSGKTMNRPGLQSALAECRSGAVGGIVVAKLDRLSRSLVDFATLLEEARKKNFNLIAIDLGLDLATPAGEFVASVLAAAAQWERRAISDRTKAGLAQRREEGVRLGRPPSIRPEIRDWIREQYRQGANLPSLAERLNYSGEPTPRGGATWRVSSIQKVIDPATEAARRKRRIRHPRSPSPPPPRPAG